MFELKKSMLALTKIGRELNENSFMFRNQKIQFLLKNIVYVLIILKKKT
jgi:hypothetical protein